MKDSDVWKSSQRSSICSCANLQRRSRHSMFGCVVWRWMNTSSALTKTIIVVLSAVCWAMLVVLWESQVQLRFLWCGRNWFESVARAVQMFRWLFMKAVVYRSPALAVNACCEYLKSLFLTLITCSIPFIILNFFFFFFLAWPLVPPPTPLPHTPHQQAVTHILLVTVNRTGAVFADRPWTLWRDVWLCGNARLVAAQFQTVTL